MGFCVRWQGVPRLQPPFPAVSLHPQEALLQQARAYSIAKPSLSTESGARWWNTGWRDWLGVRQARYFGRAKTLFQLLMAATVANLPSWLPRWGRWPGPGAKLLLSLRPLALLSPQSPKPFRFARLYSGCTPVQRQLLLPVPSIILAGSPPVPDCAAGPLRCGSWGRRIPG